jgi:hypothetical protein
MISSFMWSPAQGNLMNFVSSPAPQPASASSLLSHLLFNEGGIIVLPQYILEELHGLGSDAVKRVAERTRLILFADGPLKAAIGNPLVAGGMNLTAEYVS